MYTKWTMAQLQWTNTLSFTEQWALGLFSAWWTKAGSFLWCLCHHLNFCLHLLPARGRRKRVWKPILLVLHCSVVGCSPGWHHWLNGHESEQTLEDGEGRGAWRAAVHGVTKSQTWLSIWTTMTTTVFTKNLWCSVAVSFAVWGATAKLDFHHFTLRKHFMTSFLAYSNCQPHLLCTLRLFIKLWVLELKHCDTLTVNLITRGLPSD